MKLIQGTDDYFVDMDGTVYSIHTGEIREKSPVKTKAGYHRVNLYTDGKLKSHYIHRLVAQAYLGDIEGKVVDHINRVRNDNNVNNLRICTQKENMNNRQYYVETSHPNVYTNGVIYEVRKQFQTLEEALVYQRGA